MRLICRNKSSTSLIHDNYSNSGQIYTLHYPERVSLHWSTTVEAHPEGHFATSSLTSLSPCRLEHLPCPLYFSLPLVGTEVGCLPEDILQHHEPHNVHRFIYRIPWTEAPKIVQRPARVWALRRVRLPSVDYSPSTSGTLAIVNTCFLLGASCDGDRSVFGSSHVGKSAR